MTHAFLISGALAIADEEPKLAARIVSEAVRSVPLAMQHYAPDGAGTEGVTYWDYGSRYNIVLLSSLETALGTDFGLSQVGAFSQSGYYQIYLCGAGRVAFDFADCGRARVSEPQHFELWWFLHTEAKVELNDGGRTAVLSQHGKTFTVHLQEPADVQFQVMDCRPLPSSPNPEPQADNRGRRKLALHLTDVQAARIQVSLEP